MIIVTVAGALGKDAVVKSTQSGDQLCTFPVAGSVGFGDRKQTLWFDVTKWGKGADKLASMLPKGTKVTVSGELSQREHDGKTYLQIRADHIALQGERRADDSENNRYQGGAGGGSQSRPSRPPLDDDLDDDVPFVSCDPALEGRCG